MTNKPFRPRVSDLTKVTATELKNTIADVFDRVTTSGALAITRHDKPRAILLSVEQFEALAEPEPEIDLTDLRNQCFQMLEDMQSPEQKAGAMRAFNATPEELGEAALKSYQSRQKARNKS